MPSTLESLTSSLTPETLSSLGSALGLDPNTVQQGMNIVGPLMQGGLANASSSPQGAQGLNDMLNSLPAGMSNDPVGALTSALGGSGGLGGLLGGLMGGGSGASAASGGQFDLLGSLTGGSSAGNPLSGIVNGAFGSGLDSISKSLTRTLGFDVKPLLLAGLPMVMGFIKKQATSRNLDASGVARMLKDDNDAFLASGSPEARMVNDAFEVGKQATALKSAFSTDDLAALKSGALAAVGLVAAASKKGSAAELSEGVKAIGDLANDADPATISDVIFASGFSKEDVQKWSDSVNPQAATAAVSKAMSIVKSKAPSQASAFREMILAAATSAAEASKEGGFLGIGGKKVSDAEKAALEQVSVALG